MGIVTTKKGLSQLEELSTSAFCRRRLPIVMVRSKMAETVPEAVTFVEQVREKETHRDTHTERKKKKKRSTGKDSSVLYGVEAFDDSLFTLLDPLY